MRTTGSVQHEKRNGRVEGCGKDAPWKSPKADFSNSLGNPAKNAGFPLSTQPRLRLSAFYFWTQWFRLKPAKMAPFLTGVDRQSEDEDKFPQVTILRVTNATYIKLLQDPQSLMEFVNKHKMFAKDVIQVGPWVSLSSVGKEQPPKCWVLTLLHGKLSTMLVSALPQIMPNKPDPECE